MILMSAKDLPLNITEDAILNHLRTNRIPLETLLAKFEARGGTRFNQLFYVLQVLVERKLISMDIYLARQFACPSCKRTFATERALAQHQTAKHVPSPEISKIMVAKYVLVNEQRVLDRCPQCGQATVERIPVPGFFGAQKIRYRCTNPECGYKDEDTC